MARLKKVIGNSKVLYLGAVAHCRLHYTEHAYVAVVGQCRLTLSNPC